MTVQPRKSLRTLRRTRNPLTAWREGIAFFFVILAGGCASRPGGAIPHRSYVLAARYDMGARLADKPAKNSSLADDLQKLKAVGFNAVVLDYVNDGEREGILDLAASCGLRAYLTDRDIYYYLLTGKLRDEATLGSFIAVRTTSLRKHPAYAGAAILSGYPAQRVAEVLTELGRTNIACLYPGQSRYPAGGTVVAWLDAEERSSAGASQVERLLLELNGEIFAGWNDGLVIDFSPPTQPSAESGAVEADGAAEAVVMADVNEALPAPGSRSRIFAVESVLRRGDTWAARLRGFDRQAVAPLQSELATSSAVFVRGPRRYLFVLNPSSTPVRGMVRFPAVFGGKLVRRAVGVPATPDRIAGDVFESRGGELAIQLDLRPGDAALFELF